MYTSDIDIDTDTDAKRSMRHLSIKTAMVYLAVSLLCVAITNAYALFGHGVRSDSMDFMFLYPLVGGSLVFISVALLAPFMSQTRYRFFYKRGESKGVSYLPIRWRSRVGYNLYNSGIASLTSAAMLTGIMEIAGTGSKLIQYIRIFGITLLAAAIACQIAGSLSLDDK